MKITKEDINETIILNELIRKTNIIKAEYINSVSDEIFNTQPFFLTVLLGYRFDITKKELEEIMIIYFLIWEYFKIKKKLPIKKITEMDFEEIQNRNIQMLKYSVGELSLNDKLKVYSNDLKYFKSKSLLAAIIYKFQNRSILIKMDENNKNSILIGIKSFIECFEAI